MQTALVFSSRGSDIPGHFRSKRDQGRLLCRAVRHGSSQPTRLSGDFGREKCWDLYCSSGGNTLPEQLLMLAVKRAIAYKISQLIEALIEVPAL